MDCSTPGFPVLHYLPEFAQTHVHGVSDAIQPSHPLSSPSIYHREMEMYVYTKTCTQMLRADLFIHNSPKL